MDLSRHKGRRAWKTWSYDFSRHNISSIWKKPILLFLFLPLDVYFFFLEKIVSVYIERPRFRARFCCMTSSLLFGCPMTGFPHLLVSSPSLGGVNFAVGFRVLTEQGSLPFYRRLHFMYVERWVTVAGAVRLGICTHTLRRSMPGRKDRKEAICSRAGG